MNMVKDKQETRKDDDGSHPVGTGIGASGGAIAGAVAGTAVAGPIGALAGMVIGAVGSALAGRSVAHQQRGAFAVNITEYTKCLF